MRVRGQKAAYMNLATTLVSLVLALIRFAVLATGLRLLVDRWQIWREARAFRHQMDWGRDRAGESAAEGAACPIDSRFNAATASLLSASGDDLYFDIWCR